VLGYFAGLDLVGALALVGAPEADVRGRAEKVVTIAASYGPPMKLQALSQVARKLVASGQVPQVAVAFARRAENSLNPTTPEADQVPVLKTLARALRRAGQADEASQVATRIAKLDDYLDRVFLEDAIPFRPKRYDGREDKSSRVAVVELFTGVQCPPCVAADVAFDALLKTYQPKDVVCLQYHLHAPGPDPLTNDDTEKRAGFYDVDSTPAFFINGKKGPAVGGFKSMAKSAYDTLVEALREPLQAESQTALELAARRTGDGLDITAKVSSPKMPGREVRLLLVLLEERVHFAGRNGQRLHHHVVRAFPGGAEGLSIREPTVAQKVRVSFKELADSLHSYLGRLRFEEDEQPLELKHLKVAALIQDSKSKEVLQAKQVDVSGARSE
jgi:protein-disulfide isomerase